MCVNVYEEDGLIYNESADNMCNINTIYKSAVLRGTAGEVTDAAEKADVLRALVRKYVPGMAQKSMKETTLERTAVYAITPVEITGKYYGRNHANQ